MLPRHQRATRGSELGFSGRDAASAEAAARAYTSIQRRDAVTLHPCHSIHLAIHAIVRSLARLTILTTLQGLSAIAGTASAQQSPVADTIRGTVVATDGAPVRAAQIVVRSEDGHAYTATSSSAGRYFVVVQGGSGIYELRVRAFGYVPLSMIVERAHDACTAGSTCGLIRRDLRMNPLPIALDTVTVTALPPSLHHRAPADLATVIDATVGEALSIDADDFNSLARLQPGVVAAGPNTATPSIAGQPGDQTRVTVDGATYSGSSLPAEGLRSSGVITNTYDVARGRFSGGEIFATTISGTNLWGGALSARILNPALQYGSSPEATGSDQRTTVLNGGGGGAIAKDRLFVYGAFASSMSTAASPTLPALDQATLEHLQIAPDSLRRFLDIAAALRLPGATPSQVNHPQSRSTSLFTRLDYSLSPRHSLTARLDWRDAVLQSSTEPLSLRASSGPTTQHSGGGVTALTSDWQGWTNQLRLAYSEGNTQIASGAAAPTGHVQVLSSLQTGVVAPALLTFGGGGPVQPQRRSLLEVADEFVHSSSSSRHRIEAGILGQEEQTSAPPSSNTNGLFLFNSLADLEAQRPALFTRDLLSSEGRPRRQYIGAYLGDTWHSSSGSLALLGGVRLDAERYSRRQPLTSAAQSLSSGGHADVPSDLDLVPRLGIEFDRGHWLVDAGIGGFVGAPNLQSLALSWRQSGADPSTLVCIGQAAPRPDWPAYARDASMIPTTCADGAATFASSAPSAALFDRNFGSPRTWRASLAIQRELPSRFVLRVDNIVVHGTHLPSAQDLNRLPSPVFAIASELDRPVYAPPSAIDTASGAIAPSASRIQPSLGTVRLFASKSESWSRFFEVNISGPVAGNLLSLAYVRAHSRQYESGIPALDAGGTTAGNPDRFDWTDNRLLSEHVFQFLISRSFARRLRLAAIGRLSSGLPFTPIVGSDINGDGFVNDRAFVPDPQTTHDTLVSAGMQQLLSAASPRIGACLQRQVGRLAEASSCRTGWTPLLDVSLEVFALGSINARRLILTLRASNVTAGLDYLLHGPDRLRGWGQFPNPDARLLEVRGFDPTRQEFNYAVNAHFGQPIGGTLLRQPFQLVLQARVTLGADPRYQPMKQAIEAGTLASPTVARGILVRLVHNVPAIVLALVSRDTSSLHLTFEQRARLKNLADSLEPSVSAALDRLVEFWTDAGPMTARRTAGLQEASLQSVAVMRSVIVRTREVLTGQQWQLLPAWVVREPDLAVLRSPRLSATLPVATP